MRRLIVSIAIVCLIGGVSSPALGVIPATPAHALSNGLGATPTMGWNDWNGFGCNNDAADVESNALYIHDAGLQADGYQYIINDGCWNDLVGVDPTIYDPGQADNGTATPPQPDPGGGPQTTLPTTAEEAACGVVNGRGTGIRPATMPANENPVPAGQLFVNPYLFPPSAPCANDGMQLVADYVHSLGLKFGLWLDASDNWNGEEIPGSYGPCATCENGVPTYDQEDANTFASWGVDFIKADWSGDTTTAPANDLMPYPVPTGSPACYTQTNETFGPSSTPPKGCPPGTPDPGQGGPLTGFNDEQIAQTMYTALSNAVLATGRQIVLNLCVHNPLALAETWFAGVGNSVKADLNLGDSFASMVSMVNDVAPYSQYAGPGHFNDPDMLEVGNGGMTQTEDQAQFSLWAEMAAPLIMGTNMATQSDPSGIDDVITAENNVKAHSVMGINQEASTNKGVGGTGQSGPYATPAQDAYDLSIFGNKDVIAVDQDPLGQQGHIVGTFDGMHLILAKPLANGDVAVVLFNEGSTPAGMSTTASAIGLPSAPAYAVEDLWAHTTTETAGTISAFVQPHQAVMYRIGTSQSWETNPPQVTVLPVASSSTLNPGGTTAVQVTVTNNGRVAVNQLQVGLTVPAGWQAQETSTPGHGALPTGASVTATWQVTAGSASTPISTADLTATASYHWTSTTQSVQADLPLTLVSPVQAPYATANTTGAPVTFAQLGNQFAIVSAGIGVTTTADQYGAIYLPGSVGQNATVQTTVTGQPGAARGAQAGLIVRNDLTGAASPVEGIVLYLTPSFGGTALRMGFNGSGGTDITATVSGPAVSYPVELQIQRAGNVYTGSYSTDGGSTWHAVATETLPAATSATMQDAGIYHASGSAASSTEGDFTGLTVTSP